MSKAYCQQELYRTKWQFNIFRAIACRHFQYFTVQENTLRHPFQPFTRFGVFALPFVLCFGCSDGLLNSSHPRLIMEPYFVAFVFCQLSSEIPDGILIDLLNHLSTARLAVSGRYLQSWVCPRSHLSRASSGADHSRENLW
jgi:hypothetical protein